MSYEFEPACRRIEWLDPFYKEVWEKAFADAIPISGTFEMTPRCNFNCRMCYVHIKDDQILQYGKELTASQWLNIASQAKEAGTVWLCITGGEPLMHPEFETIYRELTQMGFFITLQTNASLIRGKMAQLLEQYPPRGVKITLYGSNDAVYEQVCQVKHGFSQVNEGIRTLRELKIPVQLISTVIRQNLEDVPKMAYYAYQNRLPWLATGGVKDSARILGSEAREVRVSERLEEQKRKQIEYLKEHPLNPERKPCTYCKDYRLGYWVMWNGEMRFCSFMNEPHISVTEQMFAEAWRQLIAYEEALEWPEKCRACEYKTVCMKCAGTLAAECGSAERVDDEFCESIKKYYYKEKGV